MKGAQRRQNERQINTELPFWIFFLLLDNICVRCVLLCVRCYCCYCCCYCHHRHYHAVVPLSQRHHSLLPHSNMNHIVCFTTKGVFAWRFARLCVCERTIMVWRIVQIYTDSTDVSNHRAGLANAVNTGLISSLIEKDSISIRYRISLK